MNNLGVVKRNIVRADKAAVEKLSRFGVATIHEAMGRVGLMKPYMRPVYADAHVCGTAVTVLLQPGDNWMMHVVAEQLQPGDVVVAACTAENTDGFFGDLLATSFRARGAQGPDHRRRRARREGPDRDAVPGVLPGDQRQGHGEGDAGLGQHPGGLRRRAGQSGRRDRRRSPTAWSWCPPPSPSRRRMRRKRARPMKATSARKLAAGVLGLDMYNMREPLAKAGLRYID